MTLRRAALVVLVGLAGCGSSSGHPPAAEPATSPPLTARPAGRVVTVGARAEGVVADARTHRVAVAVRDPDRVLVLDGVSGRILRRVALPAPARHLALAGAGGPVLVPAELANRVLTVPLAPGPVASVAVGARPHDIAVRGRRAYVTDEFGNATTVLQGGAVAATLRTPAQPGGVAAAAGATIVVEVGSDVVRAFDARTLRQTAVLGAGAGPTHAVAGFGDSFYVVDTRGDGILVYRLGPQLHIAARGLAPGAPYGIALDRRRALLWVTETARNRLVGFRVGGRRRIENRPSISLPTVRQPNSVAVDPSTGRIYVAGAARGELELIAPPAR